MGFRKDWDMNAMQHWIQIMGRNASDYHNDGFTQFEIKKDLYRLKWLIDRQLQEAGSFSGEAEWLDEQEKQRVFEILKS